MFVSHVNSLILLMWMEKGRKSYFDATRPQKTVFCPRRGSTFEL